MRLQNKKTYRHRAVGLRQHFLAGLRILVAALEELAEGDEIAQRLAHLLAVDGNHIVVHPILAGAVAGRSNALRYLALVMREHQVHTAAVNVERRAQILGTHRGALSVPTRKAVAPGRWPAHNMFGRSLFPKGKVAGKALLILAVKLAGSGKHLVDDATAELAVLVGFLLVLADVEIDTAVADVCQTCVKNLLHQLYLLNDVAAGVGLDAGPQHVQTVHSGVIAVGIVLRHLHRLQLLQTSLLCNLVLALVSIVLKVSHVGYIPDVANLIAKMLQIAIEYIERDCRARVSQMGVTIDRRAADIHSHTPWRNGCKQLFLVT